MANFICVTCGTQYPESGREPEHCRTCEDERQYIGLDGQKWTTLEELRREHRNRLVEYEPGLTGMFTEPRFALGERAMLVESPGGNILWDCISLLDERATQHILKHGGVSAMAISHPHYYTSMVEWSRAFGRVPVYLNACDRDSVVYPDRCLEFWEGDRLELHDGLTLVWCGGHFPGGTVLYWPQGAEGRGALLSGDILQVVPDRRWVSFMHSYPNYIPLNAAAVRHIVEAVEPFRFDRIYGAFDKMVVASDAKAAVARSAGRYLRAIGATP